MATFREARDCLLLARGENLIDDEELLLLFDVNTSQNPEFPYWKYERFDMNTMSDAECKAEFRFLKNDLYSLKDALRIPEDLTCPNRIRVDGMEALCIMLRRFAYPCRYGDMIPCFGRPVAQLSMISNEMLSFMYGQHGHLLSSFDQTWLRPASLAQFANAVHRKGAALDNCWGFIDGTVRPICRPQQHQRVLYNGHKRIHSIKFQSVVAANGLIANLFGPVEGKRHDSGMLAESGLLGQLERYSHGPDGRPLCIYGDPAYPLCMHLQAPFRGARLLPLQDQFNQSMSRVRTSVEWVFGDILNYFSFLDFKKDLKIGLSAVGKMYIVCALLRNALNCMYISSTSDYFGCQPPTLEEYFEV